MVFPCGKKTQNSKKSERGVFMILSSDEQIHEYNEKGWWGRKSLIDYFKEHVAETPGRTALVDPLNRDELAGSPAERITYEQLDHAVDAVATSLLKKGIVKDDIVMVQLPNTWELAMLYLAVARAGGLISPVPMQWRLKELEYVAGLTGARMLITVKDFKGFKHWEMGAELQIRVPAIKDLLTLEDIRDYMKEQADPEALNTVNIDANDIFTLCWTSGTEAEPKGCPLSHNNWIYQCNMGIQSAGIRKGDVQLTAGPLVNMASLGTTFIPWLILGGTYVLHHPFDPQLFIRQMIEEKVNYTLLVPAVANMIVKHPRADQFDLSSVRAITLGSAPPSLYTVQEFKRRWGIEIGNIWGQNEGTGIVSGPWDVPDLEKRVDHLPQFGKPDTKWWANVEGIKTKVVDPDNGAVLTEVGAVGELAYKGPNVMAGYYKRPDLTEKAFDSEGYFYTGDLFQIKEGNFIGFFDRKKDIIIRGGYNISAQEIENILLGHPKIADVAAVGLPDEIMGERTCVFAVPKTGQKVDLEELKIFMTGLGVAVYKLPERLELIEVIPRNPVGKILKSVLREELKKR